MLKPTYASLAVLGGILIGSLVLLLVVRMFDVTSVFGNVRLPGLTQKVLKESGHNNVKTVKDTQTVMTTDITPPDLNDVCKGTPGLDYYGTVRTCYTINDIAKQLGTQDEESDDLFHEK